jgi:PleD family two-component response regulator
MCDGPSITAQELVDRADRALYEAKVGGKDRVVLWTGP